MGVKDEIMTEVIKKLKDDGNIPPPIIEGFASMLKSGKVEKNKIGDLIGEVLDDVGKNKETSD